MRTLPIWIVNILLTLLALSIWQRPPGLPLAGTAPPEPAAFSRLALTPELPPEAYLVITERPLFAPDRRPRPADRTEPEPETLPLEPETVEMEPEPEPPAPPGGRLQGVISDGHAWMALYQTGNGQEILRMKTGDRTEDWDLIEVLPNGVLFAHGALRHRMPLRPDP